MSFISGLEVMTHEQQIKVTFHRDICPQDSNYPWNQRVSFASDIAAGMVSSKTERCT